MNNAQEMPPEVQIIEVAKIHYRTAGDVMAILVIIKVGNAKEIEEELARRLC